MTTDTAKKAAALYKASAALMDEAAELLNKECTPDKMELV